ncbi:hypothetical protein [Nocardia asiatica]|uniref:hypothetical protein n=1 Tax=Nocardia asiatica TaxID=209252 RepID=UPI003EDF40E6
MTLWDTVIAREKVGDVAGPLLTAIERNVHTYGAMQEDGTTGKETKALLGGPDRVKQLAKEIKSNKIIHDPNTPLRHDYWDDFARVYVWLPGNLFTGPTVRIDDPRDDLDTPAQHIIDRAQYELLNGVYTDIGTYLRNPAKKGCAENAYRNLGTIATKYSTVTRFSTAHWTWGFVRNRDGTTDEGLKVQPPRRRRMRS